MHSIRLFPVLCATFSKQPITPVHRAAKVFVPVILAIAGAFAPANVPLASAQTVTFTGAGAVNFGTANVCPSGKTVPAPCSQTMTLTYNVTASGTLGTPRAVTTGQPNLDYKLASGTTCSGSVTQGGSCKVNVTFAPIAPGARNGAVEIVDSTGNVLVTTYIYGTGVGPAVAFSPGVGVNLGNLFGAQDLAVDAAGNIFVTTSTDGFSDNSLYEMLAAGGYATANRFGFSFNSISGFTVDGVGNIFICSAENGSEVPAVQEILAAGGYTTLKTLFSSYRVVGGIAVDGSGNVFFSSLPSYGGGITELFADGGYTKVKSLASGLSAGNLAMDGGGNVYFSEIADSSPVKEMTAASGYATVKTLGSSSFRQISGLAVDASGNVYLSTGSPSGVGSVISEILAAGDYATVNILNMNNLPSLGVALDASGNIFLATSYRSGITELPRSQPPSFSFGSAVVGFPSPSSPLSTIVQNIGNNKLVATSLSISPNWDQVVGSGMPEDCAASFSLAPGVECNLSISFEPTETGSLTGAATVTDNNLNASDAAQSIPLSGTGVRLPQISSTSATYGAPYSWVAITGVNFGASRGSSTVTFNQYPAPIYRWTDTLIWATVPANGTLPTGSLIVTVAGKASNAIHFTVLPMPVVTGISPTSGPAGTVVTISGNNLVDFEGHAKVGFNGKYLPVLSDSQNAIQVAVPTGAVTDHFHVLVNDTGMNTPTFTVTP